MSIDLNEFELNLEGRSVSFRKIELIDLTNSENERQDNIKVNANPNSVQLSKDDEISPSDSIKILSLNESLSHLKSVRFSNVKMYSFDRTQGFECIPTDENDKTITLGMSFHHTSFKQFDSLDDFFKYKRKKHLSKLEEISKDIKSKLNENDTINMDKSKDKTKLDIVEDEEDEEFNQKIFDILLNKSQYEDHNVALPINMDIFCPILDPLERRNKLSEFGKGVVDESESVEINEIRVSREDCGCKCSKVGFLLCADNESCPCYGNGIGCQIDKTKFPCGCTLKRCKNPFGLKRFDMAAVRKHQQKILNSNTINDNDDLSNPNDEPKKKAKVTEKKTKKRKSKKSNYSAPQNKRRKIMTNKSDEENLIVENNFKSVIA